MIKCKPAQDYDANGFIKFILKAPNKQINPGGL